MIANLWHEAFFRPVVNALFFLYDRFASENIGIAVIELTIAIRLILLPLSILSERKKSVLESLSAKIGELERGFKGDPVRQRSEIRKVLREHHVNPWSKVVVLGFQILVLFILYQVFSGGLTAAKLDALYPFIRRPDFVNTKLLGFDVAQPSVWWALAVGVLLFAEIIFDQRDRRHLLHRRDIVYRYLFPAFSTLILAYLPITKSLFILTSMAFSAILFGVRKGVT